MPFLKASSEEPFTIRPAANQPLPQPQPHHALQPHPQPGTLAWVAGSRSPLGSPTAQFQPAAAEEPFSIGIGRLHAQQPQHLQHTHMQVSPAQSSHVVPSQQVQLQKHLPMRGQSFAPAILQGDVCT